MTFFFRVIDADGNARIIKITSSDPNVANSILLREFGAGNVTLVADSVQDAQARGINTAAAETFDSKNFEGGRSVKELEGPGASGGLGLPPLEEQALGAAFTQFLQDRGAAQGVNPLASAFARGQQAPAEQAFRLSQLATGGDPEAGATGQFAQFLGRIPGQGFGTQAFTGLALTDLSNAIRQGVVPGGELASVLSPERVGEAGDLANLARNLAQRNISPFIRRPFFERPGLTNESLFQDFAAARDRADPTGFASFLGGRFGLRNFPTQLGIGG